MLITIYIPKFTKAKTMKKQLIIPQILKIANQHASICIIK